MSEMRMHFEVHKGAFEGFSKEITKGISKGDVVLVRAGERLNKWGVLVIGFPGLTQKDLTFEQAEAYRDGIEDLKKGE